MIKREKPTDEKQPPPSLTEGDFKGDGSWNPAAPGSSRGPRYRFVQDLVRVRRAAKVSPAELADRIESSQFAQMFKCLENWKTLTSWDDWFQAQTRSVADETVKRCGYGTADPSHWEGGNFMPGEDERNLPMADPDKIREFVAGLAAAIGNDASVTPRKSDQEFFEGKAT